MIAPAHKPSSMKTPSPADFAAARRKADEEAAQLATRKRIEREAAEQDARDNRPWYKKLFGLD